MSCVADSISCVQAAQSGDLLAQTKKLYFLSAKEVEVAGGKKAIVIFVPVKLLDLYHQNGLQKRLVADLEKKSGGSHIVIVAQRTILGKSFARSLKTQKIRPRSRTLTHVQDAILDDLVHPTEIVGKRTRVRMDGSKLLKVHLDAKHQVEVETKLETFVAVYQKLTNHAVEFEFPVHRL